MKTKGSGHYLYWYTGINIFLSLTPPLANPEISERVGGGISEICRYKALLSMMGVPAALGKGGFASCVFNIYADMIFSQS